MLEEGYHFVDDNGGRHLLDKLCHVGGGLATDHGGLVMHQEPKLLAKLLLNRRRDLLVGGGVEATSGHLGREPVGFGESDRERDEVLLDLLRGEAFADLVERLNGLLYVNKTAPAVSLVSMAVDKIVCLPCPAPRVPRWQPGSPGATAGHGPIEILRRTR